MEMHARLKPERFGFDIRCCYVWVIAGWGFESPRLNSQRIKRQRWREPDTRARNVQWSSITDFQSVRAGSNPAVRSIWVEVIRLSLPILTGLGSIPTFIG